MDEQLYRTFYEIENVHWWFVARQRIVNDVLARRLHPHKGARILDVGCGTGAILQALSSDYEAYGIDTSTLAIEFCRKRGLTNAYAGTLEASPLVAKHFDIVMMLDLIEHVDDDLALLQQAATILNPGGAVLVTVPAYQWLWSSHDDVNHHKRRYVRPQLRAVIENAGFAIEFITYYNTLLFPLALVQRVLQRLFETQTDHSLDVPSAFLNTLLAKIFSLERFLLRTIRFPFGLSLLAVARKQSV